LREDKIVVGDFSFVTAVAVSRRFVFGATRGGLIVLDRLSRRWLPPLTPGDGYPAEGVFVLAGDPTDDAVWIGTAGAVLTYRPSLGAVTRTIVPGQIERIVFDRTQPIAGAFVLASGRWYSLGLGGVAMPANTAQLPAPANRVGSETLDDVYRQFPNVRSFEALLTRDETMRSARVTSAARAPERSEVWVGTAGRGILQVDPVFARSTPVPYGLLAGGAGALARTADGIVAASAAPVAAAGGLSILSEDLSTVRWVTGDRRGILERLRATRLSVRAGVAWVVGDDGVYRLSLSSPDDIRRVTPTGAGFPWGPRAILAREGGAWIGDGDGIRFFGDSGQLTGRHELAGFRVNDIAPDGEQLFVATNQGLLVRAGGDAAPFERAARLYGDARLDRPVAAVANHDSLLVALLASGEVVVVNLRTRHTEANAVALLPVAGLAAGRLAMDAQTIWASTGDVVLILSRVSRAPRTLRASAELPGTVADLLLTPGAAWIATSRGVVRLRRLADGTLP
jgi:ligand-binding sensor domain-containing protein